MGLRSLLRGGEVVSGRADPPPAPVIGGGQVYPTFVPYVTDTAAIGLSAVWRAVTIIADAIAGCPWAEYDGPELAPRLVPSSRLIRRPMATMSRREWTWRVVATEALWNTCHLLHVGGSDLDGTPWSLLPVPPNAITPVDLGHDPWFMLPPTRYVVGGQIVDAEQLTIIRRAPFPGVPDHVSGVLKLARRSFGAYLAADVHLARYWQAGGPTTTVITTDQALTDPEAQAIGQAWVNRRALGAEFPAVLGKGAHAEPFGADPTTDSAIAARRDMLADVGRYFGVGEKLLNAPRTDSGSEVYSNVEDEAVDLDRYTLAGYRGPIEDALSEILPGDPVDGRRMRFVTAQATQGSLEARSRTYPPLLAGDKPVLTVDEARMLGFGLPPMTAAQTAAMTPEPDPLPAFAGGIA